MLMRWVCSQRVHYLAGRSIFWLMGLRTVGFLAMTALLQAARLTKSGLECRSGRTTDQNSGVARATIARGYALWGWTMPHAMSITYVAMYTNKYWWHLAFAKQT
jgi:hypothetical protein